MKKNSEVSDLHAAPPSGRVVGYARVSTDDQDLALQLDAFAQHGIAPENIYKETRSARSHSRPVFDGMMREIRAGDMIVAWKPDRLFRSVAQWCDFMRLIEARGVTLRILTQIELDTSTAIGRLVAHVVMAIAEFEADLTNERTRAGLAAAKARGRVGGARPWYTEEQIRKAKKQWDSGTRTWKQIASTIRALSGPHEGKAITVTRLRARIAELEAKDAEQQPAAE